MIALSTLLNYACNILATIPWVHWVVMGIVLWALILLLLILKRSSTYEAIALGLTVLFVMMLLDTSVVLRFIGIINHGFGFDLKAGFLRIFHGDEYDRVEVFSNVTMFVPFGFVLSEYLALKKLLSIGRRIGLVALVSFGLSLSIECLQLLLRVGFFEVTDLLLNTFGGLIGAVVSAMGRKVIDLRNNPSAK